MLVKLQNLNYAGIAMGIVMGFIQLLFYVYGMVYRTIPLVNVEKYLEFSKD